MIKLKSLEIQGFRKFREKVAIDFPDSGLLLIDGDSGIGKSTIFQAISYALGVCPFPATLLKSWTGEKLQVVLTLQLDHDTIRISRGGENYFQFGEGERKTGSKAVDEGLAGLFKMNPELLFALTYRPQDSAGLFISRSDPEKKEFLSKILGLESHEDAIEKSILARKDLSAKLDFANGVLQEREIRLSEVLENSKPEVSPVVGDLTTLSEKVQSCQEVYVKLEESESQLTAEFTKAHKSFMDSTGDIKDGLRVKLQKAEEYYQQFRLVNEQRRRAHQNGMLKLAEESRSLKLHLQEVAHAKKDINVVAGKLNALKNQTCYVCHQPFVKGEVQIDEFTETIAKYEELIASEAATQTSLAEVNEKSLSIKLELDERESKFSKVVGQLQAELSSVGTRITDPKLIEIQDGLKNIQKQLYKAKDELFLAKQDLTAFQKATELRDKLKRQSEAAKVQLQTQYDEQKIVVDDLMKAVNTELDFVALLGREGFLGVIFDEVLHDISSTANEFLRRMQNTSHVTVRFDSETVKGKKNIVPVFSVGGHDTTRNGGLSGGMGTSADLAVDLAVATVVERRLGTSPGWICLDECFNGMPVSTKESAMEILQQYSKDKLVIVIDHSSELRQMFQKVLTVTEQSGTGHVE